MMISKMADVLLDYRAEYGEARTETMG